MSENACERMQMQENVCSETVAGARIKVFSRRNRNRKKKGFRLRLNNLSGATLWDCGIRI